MTLKVLGCRPTWPGMNGDAGWHRTARNGGAAWCYFAASEQGVRVESGCLFAQPVVDVLHGLHDQRQLVDSVDAGRFLNITKRAALPSGMTPIS